VERLRLFGGFGRGSGVLPVGPERRLPATCFAGRKEVRHPDVRQPAPEALACVA
jgi:hypothetical protein